MKKLRVPVVDDSAVFLDAACKLLAGLPEVAHIERAGSGLEALAQAARRQPDLVLMDIEMPGINGLETLRALHGLNPGLRMFAVTLHGHAIYRAAALESGAEDLISKGDFAISRISTAS